MNDKQTPVAFFASVLIHVMLLFAAARWLERSQPVSEIAPEAPPEVMARVVLPPPDAWRPPAPPSQDRSVPRPNRPKTPEPTPEPRREPKDRVSIGGPAPERQKTPLELRRDEDLSRRVAQGRPDAPGTAASPKPGTPRPAPLEAPQPAAPSPQVAELDPAAQAEELAAEPTAEPAKTPSAVRSAPVGPLPPPNRPSIAGSLRRLEEGSSEGPVGLETGVGQQMGDLFFDPQGADFTSWANTFRIEVYRNWIVPQSVRFGARGHVLIEFRVERDGRLSALRIVRPSGTAALDRAAANALLGSRLAPLPSDYRPPQLVIQVSFFYNTREGS